MDFRYTDPNKYKLDYDWKLYTERWYRTSLCKGQRISDWHMHDHEDTQDFEYIQVYTMVGCPCNHSNNCKRLADCVRGKYCLVRKVMGCTGFEWVVLFWY